MVGEGKNEDGGLEEGDVVCMCVKCKCAKERPNRERKRRRRGVDGRCVCAGRCEAEKEEGRV